HETASTGERADLRRAVLFVLAFGCVAAVVVKNAVLAHDPQAIQRFSLTTLSLMIEALPFLLIGTVLSAVVEVFVTEETIRRFLPRNRFAAVLCASLLGVILPVCDCATVPLVRRLLAKGVPLHAAIAFMLAAPILNPLVLFSTWVAFYQRPLMVAYRAGFGLLVAVLVGLAFSALDARYWTVPQTHGSDAEHHAPTRGGVLGRAGALLTHATADFVDIAMYFVVGVLLSSFLQTIVPAQSLSSLGQSPILSVLVMILAAFLLSVCSQADAFIAQGFFGQFTTGAIVAFLVMGPMIDMKNTLMLSSLFKKRFLLLLLVLVAECVFVIGAFVVPAGAPR
ncbi:MAG TPA: permease, partial [Spirochaetia bacterium]